VVVYEAAQDARLLYAKRCIAVAGQKVEGRQKVIYVDGRRIVDPPYSKYVDVRILDAAQSPRDSFGPVRVPEGSVFVVGDNRDQSRDSRHFGVVPVSAVVGRARLVYWSFAPASVLAGRPPSALFHRLRALPQQLRWWRLGVRVR
jgi:signal peptidase I